ncbi:rhodanese-like domain-containing protein [Shewanella schlegeliana]|uniref:Rhodanese-like domain-containing protein n=1 Tax=Shewanella schlegeliana TaxID=190308 RepID=A0ABS1SXP9_9GAMM|nr:rhodanese-like domain-containing protein [Shewanella schlegeliana]MBL4913179.1 rhodanese-like domain-containing protein [Shewanella schlegeliana]MCL1109135.1 rhodanese-like domain-containing protein [Shewanella schlegeliana]
MSNAFNLQHKLPKTMVWLLGLSVLLMMFSTIATAADQDAKVTWQKIEAGALVVDVRTPGEFAQGHLPNAINIPYEQINTKFANKQIAKDRSVVVYCRSGNRSGIAKQMLVSEGYTHVYNGGGYQMLMSQKH